MDKIIKIEGEDVVKAQLILSRYKILLHPTMPLEGNFTFNDYFFNETVIILDRNIFVKIITLLITGKIKDEYYKNIISSILLLCEIYDLSLTGGLALTEHSSNQCSNTETEKENRLFKMIKEKYNATDWANLLTNKKNDIPPIKETIQFNHNFLCESQHHKMHFLEMIKINQLIIKKMKITECFKIFLEWTYNNILTGSYSLTYFAHLISPRSNKITLKTAENLEQLLKNCNNQAWDLTYLTIWGSLYTNDKNKTYIFATNDKQLRNIFFENQKGDYYLMIKNLFDSETANEIINLTTSILKPRKHPKICTRTLDNLIDNEITELKKLYKT